MSDETPTKATPRSKFNGLFSFWEKAEKEVSADAAPNNGRGNPRKVAVKPATPPPARLTTSGELVRTPGTAERELRKPRPSHDGLLGSVKSILGGRWSQVWEGTPPPSAKHAGHGSGHGSGSLDDDAPAAHYQVLAAGASGPTDLQADELMASDDENDRPESWYDAASGAARSGGRGASDEAAQNAVFWARTGVDSSWASAQEQPDPSFPGPTLEDDHIDNPGCTDELPTGQSSPNVCDAPSTFSLTDANTALLDGLGDIGLCAKTHPAPAEDPAFEAAWRAALAHANTRSSGGRAMAAMPSHDSLTMFSKAAMAAAMDRADGPNGAALDPAGAFSDDLRRALTPQETASAGDSPARGSPLHRRSSAVDFDVEGEAGPRSGRPSRSPSPFARRPPGPPTFMAPASTLSSPPKAPAGVDAAQAADQSAVVASGPGAPQQGVECEIPATRLASHALFSPSTSADGGSADAPPPTTVSHALAREAAQSTAFGSVHSHVEAPETAPGVALLAGVAESLQGSPPAVEVGAAELRVENAHEDTAAEGGDRLDSALRASQEAAAALSVPDGGAADAQGSEEGPRNDEPPTVGGGEVNGVVRADAASPAALDVAPLVATTVQPSNPASQDSMNTAMAAATLVEIQRPTHDGGVDAEVDGQSASPPPTDAAGRHSPELSGSEPPVAAFSAADKDALSPATLAPGAVTDAGAASAGAIESPLRDAGECAEQAASVSPPRGNAEPPGEAVSQGSPPPAQRSPSSAQGSAPQAQRSPAHDRDASEPSADVAGLLAPERIASTGGALDEAAAGLPASADALASTPSLQRQDPADAAVGSPEPAQPAVADACTPPQPHPAPAAAAPSPEGGGTPLSELMARARGHLLAAQQLRLDADEIDGAHDTAAAPEQQTPPDAGGTPAPPHDSDAGIRESNPLDDEAMDCHPGADEPRNVAGADADGAGGAAMDCDEAGAVSDASAGLTAPDEAVAEHAEHANESPVDGNVPEAAADPRSPEVAASADDGATAAERSDSTPPAKSCGVHESDSGGRSASVAPTAGVTPTQLVCEPTPGEDDCLMGSPEPFPAARAQAATAAASASTPAQMAAAQSRPATLDYVHSPQQESPQQESARSSERARPLRNGRRSEASPASAERAAELDYSQPSLEHSPAAASPALDPTPAAPSPPPQRSPPASDASPALHQQGHALDSVPEHDVSPQVPPPAAGLSPDSRTLLRPASSRAPAAGAPADGSTRRATGPYSLTNSLADSLWSVISHNAEPHGTAPAAAAADRPHIDSIELADFMQLEAAAAAAAEEPGSTTSLRAADSPGAAPPPAPTSVRPAELQLRESGVLAAGAPPSEAPLSNRALTPDLESPLVLPPMEACDSPAAIAFLHSAAAPVQPQAPTPLRNAAPDASVQELPKPGSVFASPKDAGQRRTNAMYQSLTQTPLDAGEHEHSWLVNGGRSARPQTAKPLLSCSMVKAPIGESQAGDSWLMQGQKLGAGTAATPIDEDLFLVDAVADPELLKRRKDTNGGLGPEDKRSAAVAHSEATQPAPAPTDGARPAPVPLAPLSLLPQPGSGIPGARPATCNSARTAPTSCPSNGVAERAAAAPQPKPQTTPRRHLRSNSDADSRADSPLRTLSRSATVAPKDGSPRAAKRALSRKAAASTPMKNPAAPPQSDPPTTPPPPVLPNPSPAYKRTRLYSGPGPAGLTTRDDDDEVTMSSPAHENTAAALNSSKHVNGAAANVVMIDLPPLRQGERTPRLGASTAGPANGAERVTLDTGLRHAAGTAKTLWNNVISPMAPSSGHPVLWGREISPDGPGSDDAVNPMVSFSRAALPGNEARSSSLRRSLLAMDPMRLSLDPTGAVYMAGDQEIPDGFQHDIGSILAALEEGDLFRGAGHGGASPPGSSIALAVRTETELQLRVALEQLRVEAAEKDAALEALRAELSQAAAVRRLLEVQIADAMPTKPTQDDTSTQLIALLQEEVEKWKGMYDAENANFREVYNEKYVPLKDKYSGARATIHNLEAQLKEARDASATAEAAWRAREADARAHVARLETRTVPELQAKLHEAQAANDALLRECKANELNDLKAAERLRLAESRSSDLKHKLTAVVSQNATLQLEAQRSRDEAQALRQELEGRNPDARHDRQGAKDEIDALQSKLAAVTQENKRYAAQYQHDVARLAKSKATLVRLQQELTVVRSEREELKSMLETRLLQLEQQHR